ncbi:MAG: N-formylglutamate amidohydrolase [Polymorphobacter sp.]|uniref:N-formylglutamate amidohydrolase n=1 Tax=Polymorphobacter sp. TaxID=1909290 RepID=UPI003A87B902
MTAPRVLPGAAPVLIIADHASNVVPEGVDLGIDPALMDDHIALDIGTAALAEALAIELDAPAVVATVSRLVIDMNRDPLETGAVPSASDGHIILGNLALSPAERELRISAIHAPYHQRISDEIDAQSPRLLLSIHSFTPQLAANPGEERPWPVGLLHNGDDRAARLAHPLLAARGLHVGDNQPYSGRDLNYTMNRHAEARGLPYLGVEIRNDGLRTPADIRHWTAILADTTHQLLRALR